MSCPFCGAPDPTPIENAWSCRKCGREWPTLACKCQHPDCWEWVYLADYCEHHKNDTQRKKAS